MIVRDNNDHDRGSGVTLPNDGSWALIAEELFHEDFHEDFGMKSKTLRKGCYLIALCGRSPWYALQFGSRMGLVSTVGLAIPKPCLCGL